MTDHSTRGGAERFLATRPNVDSVSSDPAPSSPGNPSIEPDAAGGAGPRSRRRSTAGLVVAVVVGGIAFGVLLVALAMLVLLPEEHQADGGGVAQVGASEDGWAVWERRADGTPVRWDPCTPIVVAVSAVGTPAGVDAAALRADVEAAVADLAAASGLRFEVITTTEQPDAGRSTVVDDASGRRWAPVLVGWSQPGGSGLPLRDTDRAVAIPIAYGSPQERVYVTAQVVLNAARTDLHPGRDDRATSWGATILHELAHVVGLAHVDRPDELLHVFPGHGPVVLGEGDRRGLAAVGAAGGCLQVPAPRELDIPVPTR